MLGPPGIVGAKLPAGEVLLIPIRHRFGSLASSSLLRQPAEGEGRVVARRNDVDGVSRAPDLGQGRVGPRARCHAFDTGVERVQSGPRDAVLKPRPGGTPQRVGAGRQAPVEGLDLAPVGEDLRPRQGERAPVGADKRHQAALSGSAGIYMSHLWRTAVATLRRPQPSGEAPVLDEQPPRRLRRAAISPPVRDAKRVPESTPPGARMATTTRSRPRAANAIDAVATNGHSRYLAEASSVRSRSCISQA